MQTGKLHPRWLHIPSQESTPLPPDRSVNGIKDDTYKIDNGILMFCPCHLVHGQTKYSKFHR